MANFSRIVLISPQGVFFVISKELSWSPPQSFALWPRKLLAGVVLAASTIVLFMIRDTSLRSTFGFGSLHICLVGNVGRCSGQLF